MGVSSSKLQEKKKEQFTIVIPPTSTTTGGSSSSNNNNNNNNNNNGSRKGNNNDNNKDKSRLEKERKKAFEKYGILIPPAFGVTGTPSEKGIGPSLSVYHRLSLLSSYPTSYYDYLIQTDLSQFVLYDHYDTGIWISAIPSSSKSSPNMTNIRLLCSSNNDTTPSNMAPLQSQLFFEQRILKSLLYPKGRGVIQIRAQTQQQQAGNDDSSDDPVSISTSIQLTRGLSLFGCLNNTTLTSGWIGTHYDRTFHNILQLHPPIEFESDDSIANTKIALDDNSKTVLNNTVLISRPTQPQIYEGLDVMNRNNINIKIGGWVPYTIGSISTKPSLDNTTTTTNNNEVIHGYAAVNVAGATAAIHTTLTKDLTSFDVSKYFSINLNDIDRPPFQLSFEQTYDSNYSSSSSTPRNAFSVTQVLSFDRYQYNPLNNVAPKIRNTMAWTARLTSSAATQSSSDGSTNTISEKIPPTTEMSLGLAWQVNRVIAVKAALYPQRYSVQPSLPDKSSTIAAPNNTNWLTTALIIKRWKQPRVTCSIIKKFNATTTPTNLLSDGWGIGIEVEATGSGIPVPVSRSQQQENDTLAIDPSAYYYYNHHPNVQRYYTIDETTATPVPVPPTINNNEEMDGPQTKAVLPVDIEADLIKRSQKKSK